MFRIMVVEDDVLMGRSLAERLRGEGFAVDWVEDGYAAIKKLREHEYDAVVLDLVIHGALNGFGVLNFIELEQPGLVDRVFLATGMPEQTVMRTAPQLLPRYHHKPFSEERLIAEIVALVRPSPAAQPREAGPRILIVDDDAMSAALIATWTREMGYASETAADGREAIARLSAGSFDALVLDLVMPEVDGFSVLEFLRRHHPELIRCTIILSGLPARYRQGLEHYDLSAALEKPIDASRFRKALTECLAGRA